MDYKFFDSLSPENARTFLSRFLESERTAIEEMEVGAAAVNLTLDYSTCSLPDVLRWLMTLVRLKTLPVPATEPRWIQQAHKDGLVDFDDDSKTIVLRAAYYLGECFVRANSRLSWKTGDVEYIEKNMPVVAGFRSGSEMAPMMIVENVFLRILGKNAELSDIERAVNTWTNDMP